MSKSSVRPSVAVSDAVSESGEGLAVLKPYWPAPDSVIALVSSRAGGVSKHPYESFNLGEHVGDDPSAVRQNRALLKKMLPPGACLQWLKQVHGTRVITVSPGKRRLTAKTGDAAVVFDRGVGAVVMTADCLPVFFTDVNGAVVAVAHAGWRGLLDGVLEQTVTSMGVPPCELMAWMGPAIAPCHFEVGAEVRDAFLKHPRWGWQFVPGIDTAFLLSNVRADKYMMDIYAVARARLSYAGIQQIYGGGLCTVCDSQRFFSFRRDGITGRMASLIYLKSAS